MCIGPNTLNNEMLQTCSLIWSSKIESQEVFVYRNSYVVVSYYNTVTTGSTCC